MKAFRFFLPFFFFAVAVWTQASEPVPVKIKSVRKCEATVEKTEDSYIVDVKMAPIRCFDPSTNELLSIRKANNLALISLLKHLYPEHNNFSLSCSGMQTIKTEFTENVCRVVCRIPQKGIRVINSPSVVKEKPQMNSTSSSKVVSSKSSMLTKPADYQETIDELADIMLHSAPKCACHSEELDAFIEAIADYEEQIEKQFSALKKTIEQERELLRLEKSELLDNLAAAQKKPIQRLKELAYCAEQLETLKDFKSEPEYALFLLSNPFYREHGSVEVYRTASGCGLISLGYAAVPEKKSPKDKTALLVHKAQRIAELRAKAALAEEINGKKVEINEKYTESVSVKSKRSDDIEILSIDDYSRIINESASAFLERVRPVASWRSADGKVVFVVLGMFKSGK